MMKKLLLLIAVAMTVFLPTSAHAGTCNPSYADSLPQTSGTAGAVPPNLPGQTVPGQITKFLATGDGFDITYTPNSGAPVVSHISLGTGVLCEHWQAGGWNMPAPDNKLSKIKFEYGGSAFHTVGVINGSTQPMNVFECWGLDLFADGSGSWEWLVPNGNITKIYAGPGTQDLTFSGYNTVLGELHTGTTRGLGTCHIGPETVAGYEEIRITNNDDNTAFIDAYGSGGITSVEFFVDGVSIGTDTTPSNNSGSSEYYFEVSPVTVSEGRHEFSAKASFSTGPGTVTTTRSAFFSQKEVVAGESFTCVLNDGGMVTCWGYNAYGQTGTGTFNTQNYPLTLVRAGNQTGNSGTYLRNVTDIAAGINNACAVADGGVLCWGRNQNGVLGVAPGTLASSNVPVQVLAAGSGYHTVAVGGRHACAIKGSGAMADLKCWGGGNYGQLGNGSTAATDITPDSPANLGWYDTVAVGTGVDVTWVLKSTGEIYSFGRDNYGQLGNGATLANSSVPNLIVSVGAQNLWPGLYHACARVSGTIKCWGSNTYGELGNNTTAVAVGSPITTTQWANQSIQSMALGDAISCIVRTNGKASCLGYNAYGALGIGYVSTSELSPKTATAYLTGVNHMSVGVYHACAFDDGLVKCAGDNTEDQIFWLANNPQLTPYSVL